MVSGLVIAKGETELALLPSMANRHGLVAGATGTGKTVTLQKIAEKLSGIGVPVFMADVKGDLSGISQAGGSNPKVEDRIKTLQIKGFTYESYPVVFWDVFGQSGHPIRTTISEMGPLLISRLLGLNDVQEGVLATVFKIADDNGLLLLDLKDLRSMLQNVGDNAKVYTTQYGNIPTATVGTIQRGLLELEQQGGDKFFGEPAFGINDLIRVENGKGVVNVLAADKLITSPKVYSTFLLYLLSELFEQLPEIGDVEKPKLVFFFDEAHLLFNDAPKALIEKVQQVARLIRSKGVGVYFISQNPMDVPEIVLGQLGNRVQHALRAFTPIDQKAVSSAAKTFRPNPKIKIEQAITELGVGEALVSFLDEKGQPGIVQRAFVIPPGSRIGPITPQERSAITSRSAMAGKYEKAIDRESAYEVLQRKAQQAAQQAAKPAAKAAPKGRQQKSVMDAVTKSFATSASRQVGNQIVRGLLGSIFGKKR
ncbi:MAG: helicase HerA-like domain-containing protein [Promethearchaeati archaeon SRVP18_Atabeyarchaeia-1]